MKRVGVVVISVDNQNPTAVVGETATVKITNASQLQGLTVVGDDDAIGTVALADDTITITGVKEGTFKITINATNATAPLVLTATITNPEPITITVDNTNPDLNVGENTTINITNFQALTNPAINVADTSIATAVLSTSFVAGAITITGVKEGETTLSITADNANKLDVPITVSSSTKQLSEILTTTNLGEIENNTVPLITSAVIKANPTMNETMFHIENNPTTTTANAIGDGEYEGTVQVSFIIAKIDIVADKETINIAIDATDTLTITNWSNITNPKAVIANDAIASLSNNNGTMTITGISDGSTNVKITGDNANDLEVPIIVSKKELRTVITQTTLGELDDNQETTIRASVLEKNTNAKTEDFTISGITETKATLTGDGKYFGTIDVNFTIKQQPKELSTVITETNLGELENNQSATVRSAVLSKNSSAKGEDFTVGNITQTQATLTGAGDYTGTVVVNFTIREATRQLREVLTKTNLGEIDSNSQTAIKTAVLKLNTNLKGTDFHISNPTQTKADAIGDEKFTGTVGISYTVKTKTQKTTKGK